MQEFKHHETNATEQVFSQAETQKALEQRMNALQSEMVEQGYEETKRIKLGRNDPCPCDSGKKFKKCCIHKVNTKTILK